MRNNAECKEKNNRNRKKTTKTVRSNGQTSGSESIRESGRAKIPMTIGKIDRSLRTTVAMGANTRKIDTISIMTTTMVEIIITRRITTENATKAMEVKTATPMEIRRGGVTMVTITITTITAARNIPQGASGNKGAMKGAMISQGPGAGSDPQAKSITMITESRIRIANTANKAIKNDRIIINIKIIIIIIKNRTVQITRKMGS